MVGSEAHKNGAAGGENRTFASFKEKVVRVKRVSQSWEDSDGDSALFHFSFHFHRDKPVWFSYKQIKLHVCSSGFVCFFVKPTS